MHAPALISVVIPCYNQGRYLAEAIASVGAGCSSPVEVIVVNDGSTDETRDVAGAFANLRLISQPNSGLSAARNAGLRECRTPYVAFLDADDRFAAGGLDAGLEAIAAHPACAFVYGRCTMMSADATLLTTPVQPRIETGHYRELLLRNVIWMTAMVLFRRDAIARAGGFRTALNAAADYELYLRVTRTARVFDHAATVAHYRKHGENMSGNAGLMLRETLAALRSQRPYVLDDPALRRAYREGWHNWQEFYGTHLVTEIRAHVHAHERWLAIRKSATLGWLYPEGLRHHAGQKIRVALERRKLGRTRVPTGNRL